MQAKPRLIVIIPQQSAAGDLECCCWVFWCLQQGLAAQTVYLQVAQARIHAAFGKLQRQPWLPVGSPASHMLSSFHFKMCNDVLISTLIQFAAVSCVRDVLS